MNKILGGAMRCGKSTIVRHLCADEDMTRISTDLIRKKTRSQLEKDISNPLFAWGVVDALRGEAWANKHIDDADELVRLFIREIKALQPSILTTVSRSNGDLIIEGAHILPQFALKLTDIAHITYVIDSSPDQYIRVAMQQKTPSKNIHYVEAWSHFNRAYGRYLQKQCK